MSAKYDKAYFIAKFEAIPEGLWSTEDFLGEDNSKCAYGHCGVSDDCSTKEGDALEWLFRRGLNVDYASIVSEINDGSHEKYQQPTPKQRILAALRDLPYASS